MKNKLIFAFALIVLVLSTNCSKDDTITDLNPEVITQEKMLFFHNNDRKNWRITQYYSNYYEEIKDNKVTDCLKDDIYTFSNEFDNSIINLGSERCFLDEGTVTTEIANARYFYDATAKTLTIKFKRR